MVIVTATPAPFDRSEPNAFFGIPSDTVVSIPLKPMSSTTTFLSSSSPPFSPNITLEISAVTCPSVSPVDLRLSLPLLEVEVDVDDDVVPEPEEECDSSLDLSSAMGIAAMPPKSIPYVRRPSTLSSHHSELSTPYCKSIKNPPNDCTMVPTPSNDSST